MRGPEGVAIEMQDINYGSGGSPGAYGGMSGEAMPPAQVCGQGRPHPKLRLDSFAAGCSSGMCWEGMAKQPISFF